MPIAIKCEECGRQMRVKDALAGKRIRCPECEATVTVEAEIPVTTRRSSNSAPRPEQDQSSARRRPRREPDDSDTEIAVRKKRPRRTGKRQKSSSKGTAAMWLYIGGGAGLVATIAVVLVLSLSEGTKDGGGSEGNLEGDQEFATLSEKYYAELEKGLAILNEVRNADSIKVAEEKIKLVQNRLDELRPQLEVNIKGRALSRTGRDAESKFAVKLIDLRPKFQEQSARILGIPGGRDLSRAADALEYAGDAVRDTIFWQRYGRDR